MLAIVVENLCFYSFIQVAYFLILILISDSNMIKKPVFLVVFFLSTLSLFSQSNNSYILTEAKEFFNIERYGVAQNLFYQIYTNELTSESEKEEALFYIAICNCIFFCEFIIMFLCLSKCPIYRITV